MPNPLACEANESIAYHAIAPMVSVRHAFARAGPASARWAFVLDDALWPYMRLWLEIASLAARGDPTSCRVGEVVARGFLAWTTAQIADDDPARGERHATRLFMAIEGAILLKSLGLGGEVAATAADP